MQLLNVVMIIAYIGWNSPPVAEVQFSTMERCMIAAKALWKGLDKTNPGFVVTCAQR